MDVLDYQYRIITESSENVFNYDKNCARLLREKATIDTVEDKGIVPVIPITTEGYMKKIDDSFSLLDSVTLGNDKIAEFFSSIHQSAIFSEIPLNTPVRDINDIGRINPEYLTQYVKDMANTINDIVNGKVTMRNLMNYYSKSPAVKIKKQIVIRTPAALSGTNDIKEYFKSQPQATIIQIDGQSLDNTCIPFLRSFPIKKKEMAQEVGLVKNAITESSNLLNSYTDTIVALKTKGKLTPDVVNTLNYYLYNQNRVVEELITYTTFMLVTKINAYTFNINSYNELYTKVVNYVPEGERAFHESVFEYSLASADINDTTNDLIHGNGTAIIDWAQRVYDSVLSQYNFNSGSSAVEFLVDKYTGYANPYGGISNSITEISEGLKQIPMVMRDRFSSPVEIMKKIGLDNQLLDRFNAILNTITDISEYQDNDPNEKTLLAILGELKDAPEACENLASVIGNCYGAIGDLKRFIDANISDETLNPVSMKEMKELLESTERDYCNLVGIIAQNVIQRYKALENLATSLTHDLHGSEEIDCTDIAPTMKPDYNKTAMESCMDIQDIVNMFMIESEVLRFKEDKYAKEYGVPLFEEVTNNSGGDTNNNGGTQQEEKKTPDVTENPSEQTGTDKKQNEDAANQANAQDNKKLSERIKDLCKELSKKVEDFFSKVIPDFTKYISTKLSDNSKFLNENRDAIANRSFTGINVKIYNYFGLPAASILSDIQKVSSGISSLTAQDLSSFKDEKALQKKLFPFLTPASGMEFDEYMKNYYKVGPNSKAPEKVTLAGAQLKTKVQEMITFCDDCYTNNGYTQISDAMEALRNATKQKLKAFEKEQNISDDAKKNLSLISREIQVFASAALMGYRDRGTHFMFTLRRLVPKNANKGKSDKGNNTETEQTTDQGTTDQNTETETT